MESEMQNYNVNNPSGIVEETFHVGGMSCSGCAKGVERALTKLDGVESVEVSLAESSATVAYHPRVLAPDKMQRAVEVVGYTFGKDKAKEVDRPKRNGGCC